MLKNIVLTNLSYTDLVYGRIKKKLKIMLSNKEIETYIYSLISNSYEKNFSKKGKNYYIVNTKEKIRITVNANTFRIITVDKLI